nr:GAF domain-containing sensor histidine kinase [Planctomycetota bacterium]
MDPRVSQRYDGPVERLHALIEASLALGESSDLTTLLRRILDLATRHVGADRGALFIAQPATGDLVSTIFHGDELEQIHLPTGRGIAGSVVESGRSVRIDDAYEDERFDRSIDERTGYRTRSLLVVPMRLRNREVVGAIELLNKAEGGTFDDDDEDFLEAFGAQAAVALETARLTEERIRGARMEAVGAVAANLVHDLKNPLSGIHGYTDLILQGPPPELLSRCVDGIRRQTTRMNHMVSSILEYVRGDAQLLLSKIDMDELLDEIVEDLRAACGRADVEIERAGERVGIVRADAMALRRLVDNLSRNAFEAMEGGGRVRIGAVRADDD